MCSEALGIGGVKGFTPPFQFEHGALFAPAERLRSSGCAVASAEGMYREVSGHKRQFQGMPHPRLLLWWRDPVQRTLSQFHHDRRWADSGGRQGFHVPETLAHVYAEPALLDGPLRRYGNWQTVRMVPAAHWAASATNGARVAVPSIKQVLSNASFIGMVEHYHLSMCLFAFTFAQFESLRSCRSRVMVAYNRGCCESTVRPARAAVLGLDRAELTSRVRADGGAEHGCATGADFDDVAVGRGRDNATTAAPNVDSETLEAIRRHTAVDRELYDFVAKLFWTRIGVMREVLGWGKE